MGKETVRFRCHHCKHCCTEVVCLPTPWDVIRIAKATGKHPRRFIEFLDPDEITGVKKSDPTWLECEDGRYIMAVYRGKKGCYFFDKKTRLCTIYDVRPLLCRLYPFNLHETKKGKFKSFTLHKSKDVDCPRHKYGKVKTKPLYKLYQQDCEHQEDYERLVRAFNKKKRKGKRPQDFLKMFVEER